MSTLNVSARDLTILELKWGKALSNQATSEQSGWSRSTIARVVAKHESNKTEIMNSFNTTPQSNEVVSEERAAPIVPAYQGVTHNTSTHHELSSKDKDVIRVSADMITRLYSVMFLTSQAVSNMPIGVEILPQTKVLFNQSLVELAMTFPQLNGFDVDIVMDGGDIKYVGQNIFSSSILHMINEMVTAPVSLR